MNKLSLFSGIGGDDLASEWAGIETVCFVEKDKYCQKVLHKHWPDIPLIEDVKDVTKEKVMEYASSQRFGKYYDNSKLSRGIQYKSSESSNTSQPGQGYKGIDIISGGFPCQPHSVAGKRKGSLDERNLWPEFRRIIGEIKPRWVVAENVPGLFSSDAGRFFGEVLADLAEMGYSVGWCTFGAVDVGALHRRNRVFIVANARHQYINLQQRIIRPELEGSRSSLADTAKCFGFTGSAQPNQWDSQGCGQKMADTICQGLQGRERCQLSECPGQFSIRQSGTLSDTKSTIRRRSNGEEYSGRRDKEVGGQNIAIRGEEYWSVEPDVGRVANGVPSRVDRLKGLGNAVVPQQIYPIYKAIVEIEQQVIL